MGDEMKHGNGGEQKAPKIGKEMLVLLLVVAIAVGTIVVAVYLHDSEPISPHTQVPGKIMVAFMTEVNQSVAWHLINETGGEVTNWQPGHMWINGTHYDLIVAILFVGEGNETELIDLYEALSEVHFAVNVERGVTG